MAGKRGRSGRKTAKEEATWAKIAVKGCDYIYENFHKFDEKMKVHIALEVMKKMEPWKFVSAGAVRIIFDDTDSPLRLDQSRDDFEEVRFEVPLRKDDRE